MLHIFEQRFLPTQADHAAYNQVPKDAVEELRALLAEPDPFDTFAPCASNLFATEADCDDSPLMHWEMVGGDRAAEYGAAGAAPSDTSSTAADAMCDTEPYGFLLLNSNGTARTCTQNQNVEPAPRTLSAPNLLAASASAGAAGASVDTAQGVFSAARTNSVPEMGPAQGLPGGAAGVAGLAQSSSPTRKRRRSARKI